MQKDVVGLLHSDASTFVESLPPGTICRGEGERADPPSAFGSLEIEEEEEDGENPFYVLFASPLLRGRRPWEEGGIGPVVL